MVSSQVLALAVSLFPLASWAKNDWSEACLSGQCDWDIPSGNGSSGTVRVVRVLFRSDSASATLLMKAHSWARRTLSLT